MAQAKLVRNELGTYVDRGDGRRVLVSRPGRPSDVEVLKRFRLEEATPGPDTAGAPAPQSPAPQSPEPPPAGQQTPASTGSQTPASEPPPASDGDAGGDGGDPFPRHNGGPNWQLSDGSAVRSSRADAERAEAQLAADQGGDSDEGGDGDGNDG